MTSMYFLSIIVKIIVVIEVIEVLEDAHEWEATMGLNDNTQNVLIACAL